MSKPPESQTTKPETILDGAVCVTYYREKSNRFLDVWDRWKLFDLHGKPWRFWRGNIKVFGFWNSGNISITSPFLSRLIHWKYRKSSLGLNLGGVKFPIGKVKHDE